MFSSKTFRLSDLTFRSLIYFECILGYGIREYSNLIFLHVVVQVSQHHLLKRLFFLHCVLLPPLLQINSPEMRGFNSGLFYPIPLIRVSVCIPVPHCIYDYIVVVQSLSHVQLFVTPWTQHAKLPCPSPSTGACSNSCPLSQ